MTSLSTSPGGEPKRHACTICARRKVKCDKAEPCSNCLKAGARCVYEPCAPPKPRKRAADEELLARISRYEALMRRHNIDYSEAAHTWITSGPEGRVKGMSSEAATSPAVSFSPSQPTLYSQTTTPAKSDLCVSDPVDSIDNQLTRMCRNLWDDLPSEASDSSLVFSVHWR